MALVTQSWGPQHVIVSQSTESPGAVVVAVSPPRGDSNSGRHYDPRNLQVGPMLAAPVSRESLAINDATKMTTLQRTVQALGVGASADDGYWTPTTAAGEFGLLEAFHRKSAHRAAHGHSAPAAAVDALDAFVLVYGRPDEELRRNFSNHRGERVDLSLECFQLSRATLALRELEHLRDEAAVTGKAVKDGLRSTLPAMHQDSYYLVAYRDYSSFATRTFARIAKRVRLGSPKYVEVHFAVRVGQSAGVFMPISAAQFMNGWELLNAARIAPGTAQRTDAEDSLQRWALTSEQFKSLGPLPGDLFAVESTATYSTAAAAAGRAPQEVHVPSVWYRPGIQADPSPWDFSPAALQFRAQRYIERQYMAVGRLVVKGAIVVGGVLLIRYALQARNGDNGNSARGRGGRSQCRDDRTVAEALFESAVEMNPLGFVRFMAGSST